MNIAYIMSRFPKLTETFVLDDVIQQQGLGSEVLVYPLLREPGQLTHPEVTRVLPKVRFTPFVSHDILSANWKFLCSSPAKYCKAITAVLWGTLPSRNFFVGALGILPKSVFFAQQMRLQGVEHVHAHFATHPALSAFVIHRLTGIPFSFTAHGSDLHVDQTMLDKKLAEAKFAVTVSSYNKESMVAKCGEFARRKIHVLHCGVDTDFFCPCSRPENRMLRLICVASFGEVKGHKYLVEACRLLRDRGLEFCCELVGEGELRTRIQDQVAKAGLSEHFIFHGAVRRPEVREFLQQCDVIVLASVPTANGKREGIPVCLMEGMACGLPAISTRLSGIPELVRHGECGLLVQPADAAALADAIAHLQDRALRQQFGRAARAQVVTRFNLKTNSTALNALFRAGGGNEVQRTDADALRASEFRSQHV
jgi:colanic acid/amylovoran biosynthesis glycosyltransferase